MTEIVTGKVRTSWATDNLSIINRITRSSTSLPTQVNVCIFTALKLKKILKSTYLVNMYIIHRGVSYPFLVGEDNEC